MPEVLTGFFSYSRSDDEAHGRQLSAVREFLSTEVQTLLGRPFELFQDVEHSAKGRRWEPQYVEALRRADVFIPVISPAFFASDWCRREFTTFVSNKAGGAQDPAIFPLYFVTVGELEQEAPTDELIIAIRQFQFEDIREFRLLHRRGGINDISPRLARQLQQVSNGIKEFGLSERRQPPPAESIVVDEPLQFDEVTRADDLVTHRALVVRILELLSARGYPERDLGAAATVLRELCDNVARHVGSEAELRATVGEIEKQSPHNHAGFYLEVADPGPGFNLPEALRLADEELAQGGREHGLLRAFRLGELVNALDPHRVAWLRELAPHIGVSAFSTAQIVPVVFSWAHEAIRLNDTVITFRQWDQYQPRDIVRPTRGVRRSDSFMDLVLDPLLRPGHETVGIEIIGHGWSWSLGATAVLREIHAFITRSRSHLQGAVVFADTDASDQRSIRDFTRQVGWPFYETLERARAYGDVVPEASTGRESPQGQPRVWFRRRER